MSNETELELLKKALAKERKKVAIVEKNFEEKTYELYQANEVLKKQHETILKAEKMISIGRMAAGFAHEINNPLTFVSSNLELIKAHLEGEGELTTSELDELMTDVSEGLSRIKSIVSRVNDYARSENSERTAVNINKAILSTIHLVKSRLSDWVKLETRLDDIPTVYGDLNELKQVVLNLLINAIDALEDNQAVNPDGRIFISTGHNTINNQVVLTISDNGTGIDKTHLHQLFEPFFTTKQIGSGSGLGLYVCHQIVSAHQGQIDVESIQGEGATFTIIIPSDLRREPR